MFFDILKKRRKILRKNKTYAESFLMKELNGVLLHNNHRAYRNQIIIGPYVVDIICDDRNLIVEVDGKSHIGKEEYDFTRDNFFRNNGFNVIHFSNSQVVNDTKFVIEQILSFPKSKENYKNSLRKIGVINYYQHKR